MEGIRVMDNFNDVEKINEEDERYVLTPEYLLYATLEDFGIKVGYWIPRLWKSIYNSYVEDMCKAGHIEKQNENRWYKIYNWNKFTITLLKFFTH